MIERLYEVVDGRAVEAPSRPDRAYWWRARVRVVGRDLPEDHVDLTRPFDPERLEARVVVDEAADLSARRAGRRRWGRCFYVTRNVLRASSVDALRLMAEDTVADCSRAGGRLS